MNEAHLHLLVNHIPVLGSIAVVGLIFWARYKQNDVLTKLSLQLMVLIGVLTIPAYFTGEPAEENIEHLAGVSESLIERHEELALYGLIAAIVMGSLGLWELYLSRKKKMKSWFWKVNAAVGIIALIFMALIANQGGEIRHSEIRQENSK